MELTALRKTAPTCSLNMKRLFELGSSVSETNFIYSTASMSLVFSCYGMCLLLVIHGAKTLLVPAEIKKCQTYFEQSFLPGVQDDKMSCCT